MCYVGNIGKILPKDAGKLKKKISEISAFFEFQSVYMSEFFNSRLIHQTPPPRIDTFFTPKTPSVILWEGSPVQGI